MMPRRIPRKKEEAIIGPRYHTAWHRARKYFIYIFCEPLADGKKAAATSSGRIKQLPGPSMVPVCASRIQRHYSGNQHHAYVHYCFVSICAKRFHRHYSGRPALPNRHYRGLLYVPSTITGRAVFIHDFYSAQKARRETVIRLQQNIA